MARQQDVLVTGDDLHVRKNVVAHEAKQQPEQKEPERRDPPEYTATRKVRAFRVKSIDRNPDSTVVLLPEDSAFDKVQLGGKQAENIPGWNPSTPNSDPGYAVLDETGNRYWMGTQEFEALYGQSKEQQAK